MGTVYFLKAKDQNLFKIGVTRGKVETRLKTLSTGSPYPLEIYKTIEYEHHTQLETYFHNLFGDKRAGNGEFFHVHIAELDFEIEKAKRLFQEVEKECDTVEQLRDKQSNGSMLDCSEEARSVYTQLRDIRHSMKKLEFEELRLENRLKILIGENEGIEGVATWKTQTLQRFDTKKFKAEHPDLYESFLEPKLSRVLRLK